MKPDEGATPKMEAQATRGMSRRRLIASAFGGLIALPSIGSLFGRCLFSGPRWQGEPGEFFDGTNFKNIGDLSHRSAGDVIRWRYERKVERWKPPANAIAGAAPPERVGMGQLRVTPVGHATVLVQMDEINLLTDPVWSERCSPIGWAGPKRMRPPGISYEDLPPVDAVLISHNHYDHLDLATLKRLARDHKPTIYCALGNAAYLAEQLASDAHDLLWWQAAAIGSLTIRAVPAQHWSGRGLCDRVGTHWCGYNIESKHGNVFFAGDTGFGPHFEMIRAKLGPPRLALLPIGAHLPRWFMGSVHMAPDESVEAHRVLGAARSLAIHHGIFQLADEMRDQPVEELKVALARAGLISDVFATPEPGIPIIET